MHKLLLVVLLATLISCKKTNKAPDITIEYRYTADVSDSYQVYLY